MKKLFSVLIALIICFSTVVFGSEFEYNNFENIDTNLTTLTPTGGLLMEEGMSDEPISDDLMFMSSGQPTQTLEEYLRQQLIAHVDVIDISAFKIPASDFSNTYFSFVFDNSDLPIHAAYSDRVSYYSGNITYTKKFKPLYIYSTKEESDIKIAALDALTTSLAEHASAGKTELEKALFLFDKISLDYYYTPGNTFEKINHTPYSFLDYGHGVCQGYAILYKLALKKLGIKSVICTNSNPSVNHAWNYVKIDNKWYHADPTWSYYADVNDKVSRKYFLLSDNTMLSDGLHGVDSEWIPYSKILESLDCTSDEYKQGYLFRTFPGEPIYRDDLSLYFNHYIVSSTNSMDVTFRNDSLKTPDALMTESVVINGQKNIYLYTENPINKKINIIISGYAEDGTFIGCEKLTANSLPRFYLVKFPVPEFDTTPYKIKWMLLDNTTLAPITYFAQTILN